MEADFIKFLKQYSLIDLCKLNDIDPDHPEVKKLLLALWELKYK